MKQSLADPRLRLDPPGSVREIQHPVPATVSTWQGKLQSFDGSFGLEKILEANGGFPQAMEGFLAKTIGTKITVPHQATGDHLEASYGQS